MSKPIKYKRFLEELNQKETIFLTRVLDSYHQQERLVIQRSEYGLVREVAAKANRRLSNGVLQKLIFAIADTVLCHKVAEDQEIVLNTRLMDVIADIKAATAISDFLANLEEYLRRKKYPFVSPVRFRRLLAVYPLDFLLQEGSEIVVLKYLASNFL